MDNTTLPESPHSSTVFQPLNKQYAQPTARNMYIESDNYPYTHNSCEELS